MSTPAPATQNSAMEHKVNVAIESVEIPRRPVGLRQLAVIIGRSYEWTRENWRTIKGLPQPFIGQAKHQHPSWRGSDVNAFMAGKMFDALDDTQSAASDAEPIGRDRTVASLLKGL